MSNITYFEMKHSLSHRVMNSTLLSISFNQSKKNKLITLLKQDPPAQE